MFSGVRRKSSHTNTAPKPGTPPTIGAARDAVRGVVTRSVEQAIGSARRVAVLASGGVDSAVVLAVARAVGAPDVDVFAVALDFEGPGDDRPYMRLLEERLNCRVSRVTPEECARNLSALRGVDRSPFTFVNGLMVLEMMRRAREEGAEVVLTGSGGDDIFDGDPRSISELTRRGKPLAAFRMARGLCGFARPSYPAIHWALRPLVASFVPRALRVARARWSAIRWWGKNIPEWAGPEIHRYLRARRTRNAERLADALESQPVPYDPLEAESAVEMAAYSAWRNSQLIGVPRRDPLEDAAVAAVVASIPPNWLLSGGMRRGLFREAFADHLPARVTSRLDKARFEPAFARMLAASGGLESLRELADVRELESLELVRPRPFQAAFDQFIQNPRLGECWTTVWPTLAVEAFLREERQRS